MAYYITVWRELGGEMRCGHFDYVPTYLNPSMVRQAQRGAGIETYKNHISTPLSDRHKRKKLDLEIFKTA